MFRIYLSIIIFLLITPLLIVSKEYNPVIEDNEITFSFFDLNSPNAPVILSDPEQPLCSVKFGHSNSGFYHTKNYMDLVFGSNAPVLSLYKRTSNSDFHFLSVYVKGLIRSRFGFNTGSFDNLVNDFYGGLSFVFNIKSKKSHYLELFVYHQSSHIGDGQKIAEDFEPAANFSHEIINLYHNFNLSKNVKIGYGPLFVIRKDTSVHEGLLGFQANSILDFDILDQGFYLSGNLKIKKNETTDFSLSLQGAYILSGVGSRHSSSGRKQYLIIEYHKGYSCFGIFNNEHEEMISAGLIVDL